MRKSFTFLLLLFLYSTTCNGQNNGNGKVNALSFEVGKTGLLYNLTFDHKFDNRKFGFRLIGGSNFGTYVKAYVAGAGGYYLAGSENKFLELGADVSYLHVEEFSDDQKGFTLFYPDHAIKTSYISLNAGYRKYSKKSLFRIGLSPGFISEGFVPGGYVSIGLLF